jgi:hypothetical protein
MICKFSRRHDSSLFVFGCNSKKRPNTLMFGRTYDQQVLDMIELRMEKFISSKELKVESPNLTLTNNSYIYRLMESQVERSHVSFCKGLCSNQMKLYNGLEI